MKEVKENQQIYCYNAKTGKTCENFQIINSKWTCIKYGGKLNKFWNDSKSIYPQLECLEDMRKRHILKLN